MIEDYVHDVMYAQFEDDQEVANDKLLKNFFKQIGNSAFGNITGFP